LSLDTNIESIIDAGGFHISDLLPSEWAEQNRVMTADTSAIEGSFLYKNAPYMREIADFFAPSHDGHTMAVMKGAQIGYTLCVVENVIGWIISQNPGNIMYTVGHDELVEEAMTRVDKMIDSCGIRPLIKSSVKRARNMKTGDTGKRKEYRGGFLVLGVPNAKTARQRSMQFGFIDDFESAKGSDKQAGSMAKLFEQRFSAYAKKRKLCFSSSPELKKGSNIEPLYLLGDQRRYFIPCPCCGEFITLEWSVAMNDNEKEKGGIVWEIDDDSKVIASSVGYKCQKCAGVFDDKNKNELLQLGEWRPTAEPSQPGYYSYQISSLYAPTYMFDWEHYAREYHACCPPNGPRREEEYKTFVNVALGLTYDPPGVELKANQIMKNIRPYKIGTIPESLSIKDGNGQIILLTCACDLNGTLDDARLDYEIVGWSVNAATYSIDQGSIGTFIPREGSKKKKADRKHWTYEHNKSNSVWPVFQQVLDQKYSTDTGRRMIIAITGVDTGHYTEQAYEFVDNSNTHVVGIKGKDIEKYVRLDVDRRNFKPAVERGDLYLAEVNYLKDELANKMKLKWDSGNDDKQPSGFMNFPTQSEGKYSYQNFFLHYESERRVPKEKDGTTYMVWEKKPGQPQNHFLDVAVYNMVLREIFVYLVGKELKNPKATWANYAAMVLASKNK